MTNYNLLIQTVDLGIQLMYFALLLILASSIWLCISTFITLIQETRLPGKRLFGFNCDSCTGKYRANGKPYFRCYIKKPILFWMLKNKLLKPLTTNN